MPSGVPPDVAAIRTEIRRFLDTKGAAGRKIGGGKGVYTFYDYDGEPIYVGQTKESIRSRIGRHLTNQRTDAVAMNVISRPEMMGRSDPLSLGMSPEVVANTVVLPFNDVEALMEADKSMCRPS